MTTLLVANGGGHLKQLSRLLPRLGVDDDRVWVTFDTGLSRSLLRDEKVFYAPYAHPHDLKGTAKDALFALKLYREHRFDRVISTGANLAVAFLPIAKLFGARAQFIETATRVDGFSVSGRVLGRVPWIERYTQHPALADKRWNYGGTVFEGFAARHITSTPKLDKIVVILGSNESYGFERLLHRLQAIIPTDVEVLWQVGHTTTDIPGARNTVPSAELDRAMREADAIIAHAGTGAALSALESGHYPVLIPRRSAHGEHIDDHQELTANYLSGNGLALAAEADDLTWNDIVGAASWTVTDRVDVPPFAFAAR